MESALSSLIIFTVGLFAAMTLSTTYLETQDSLWTAEQTRQAQILERARTSLDLVSAETQSDGALVRVQLRNNGYEKLSDFDRWDVIIEYYSAGEEAEDPNIYAVDWLSHTTSSLGNQQWMVSGIYMDAESLAPEVFEPGILNPDEEMVIQIQLLPTVTTTTTNRITISTINGIHDTIHFVR